MMEYTEVTISTSTYGSEIISDLLMRLGAAGTQILDRADLPDPDKPTANWELMDQSVIDAMPEDVQVKAWFDEETLNQIVGSLKEQLSLLKNPGMGDLSLTLQGVKEEDWANNWKQYYKPFRLGDHMVVKPTWEPFDLKPDDLLIEIDPGMAFGTGTHETTAMCVGLIEKYYQGGTLLDVGTGSGILAIAAARLGAKGIVAVDIDPDAVRVAIENVEHNGLADAIEVREGDLLQGLSQRFHFAVANILAPVICMLAAPLKNHLMPGGKFICSGIIAEAEEDVNTALLSAGYIIDEIQHKGDWVAFACHV
ncbi:MAG: 50S ribosomal protein L11 methyltransferase [Clostridiales bacterium]|nr:50S ribosomal protein L11 methyltransferase [Clostridiales bacterium]